VAESPRTPWIPFTFLALPPERTSVDSAHVVLIPVPYDSTTSYKGGAREGPRAIIEASHQLEEYDLELDTEVCKVGIHTAPWLEAHVGSPEAMVQRVREAVSGFARRGKLVGVLGGEHTVTIGAVQGMKEAYPDLSVLYLDAHADLREEYMGTRWGHASVARRVYEICPLIQVGVRSLSLEEMRFIRQRGLPCFTWTGREEQVPYDEVLAHLSRNVYVSVDVDVLDPSLMAAVGTPEPGGMSWPVLLSILKAVARERRIVGFDVSELCPPEGPESCAYVAAKLVYKLIGYATSEVRG